MIIVVAHTKGGVGKSTIAFNLALSLQKEYDVIVYDLDFQKVFSLFNNLRERDPLQVRELKTIDELKKAMVKDDEKKLVIVDVGGFDSEMNRLIMMYSDLIITPVDDSAAEIKGLLKFEEIIEEIEQDLEDPLEPYILFNKIDYRTKNLEDLEEFIKNKDRFKKLNTVLRYRSAYKKAPGLGQSVEEYENGGAAAKEIHQLTKEIKTLITNTKGE